MIKLRQAMNLNSLFLEINALGTMLADANNRLMESNWHSVRKMGMLYQEAMGHEAIKNRSDMLMPLHSVNEYRLDRSFGVSSLC